MPGQMSVRMPLFLLKLAGTGADICLPFLIVVHMCTQMSMHMFIRMSLGVHLHSWLDVMRMSNTNVRVLTGVQTRVQNCV